MDCINAKIIIILYPTKMKRNVFNPGHKCDNKFDSGKYNEIKDGITIDITTTKSTIERYVKVEDLFLASVITEYTTIKNKIGVIKSIKRLYKF